MILSVNWGNALTVTLLGFLLVVILLIVLVGVLYLFGYIMKKPCEKKANNTEPATIPEGLTLNEQAAVAMAIHLCYGEPHDIDNVKVTFGKVQKNSQWNAKIYGLNNLI